MIKTVHLKYFKKFKDQSFNLADTSVLAGPNNTGKTTLFQAIATWHFAFREWHKQRGSSTPVKRSGVSLTRKDFLSLPVQRFNLLWTDASTALRKDEGGGRGAANPRIIKITLAGSSQAGVSWHHTMEFRYANSELVYAKPAAFNTSSVEALSVVYVPSFSGIETEEKVHTTEYQDWLIGQGKPGDIIRNLLTETFSDDAAWKSLQGNIEEIFGYHLLPPICQGRPFILCEYLPGIPPKRGHGGLPNLDIASAGSGFLQALLLLSFFYARPSSVLLFDEPDAHLHVALQKQIYDRLREVASERKCQMIVATHSEVVIDNTAPDKIISFYGPPHQLIDDGQRDEVREALKRLTAMDILCSKDKPILYVEGQGDFDILHAWAKILGHPLTSWFSDPFRSLMRGNDSKEARAHFFALRAVRKEISGVLLLDGDNKNLPKYKNTESGLKIIRWSRYEIENYLLNYELISRFLLDRFGSLFSADAQKKMHSEWPPGVIKSPLDDVPFVKDIPASKDTLPKILSVPGIDISKPQYYQLAAAMQPTEIHPEIIEVLDAIKAHWGGWGAVPKEKPKT